MGWFPLRHTCKPFEFLPSPGFKLVSTQLELFGPKDTHVMGPVYQARLLLQSVSILELSEDTNPQSRRHCPKSNQNFREM